MNATDSKIIKNLLVIVYVSKIYKLILRNLEYRSISQRFISRLRKWLSYS